MTETALQILLEAEKKAREDNSMENNSELRQITICILLAQILEELKSAKG